MNIICACLRDITAFTQRSNVNIALAIYSLSRFPMPTSSSHVLSSSACTCTKNRSFLALPLVHLHSELLNRAQCVMGSTPKIHQSETLPFVGPPATHSCYVRIVSQAQQICFSHLKNATLRINCVVFCVTSPLAHDYIRSLHRSINAVRRHEVVLGHGAVVFLASLVKT